MLKQNRLDTGLLLANIVLALTLIPISALGFNSHHDGLILTDVRLTRAALIHGGPWPFNQFGGFWIFPHVMASMLLPNSYTFLSVRLVTVLMYWLTAWGVFLVGSTLMNRRFGLYSAFVLLVSEPFVGTYQSDFLPWPSAVSMSLIIFAVFFVVQQETAEIDRRHRLMMASCLTAASLFCRVQVGLLGIFSLGIYLLLARNRKYIIRCLAGAAIFLLPYVAFMASMGWLRDSFKDEFVFGSVYATQTSKIEHSPLPVFTILIAVAISIVLILQEYLIGALSRFAKSRLFRIALLLVLALLFSLGFFILNRRGLNLLSVLTVSSRRFWIGLYLGTLFAFLIRLIKGVTVKNDGNAYFKKRRLYIFLFLASLANISQIWPLFDQMHTWWGCVPTVILFGLLLDKSHGGSIDLRESSRLLAGGMTSVVVLYIAQFLPQMGALNQAQFASSVFPDFRATNSSTSDANSLQDFFAKNIPLGSSVTNLCQNSDVFFQNGLFRPSSRLFVYWPQMGLVKNYLDPIMKARADIVLTCSLNELYPQIEKVSEIKQRNILKLLFPDEKLIAQTMLEGKSWKIYVR